MLSLLIYLDGIRGSSNAKQHPLLKKYLLNFSISHQIVLSLHSKFNVEFNQISEPEFYEGLVCKFLKNWSESLFDTVHKIQQMN